MMHLVKTLGVIALASVIGCASTWVGIDGKVGQSVKLIVYKTEKETFACTAAIINEKQSYLATAAHCMPEGPALTRVDGIEWHPIAVNTTLDLAVIQAIGIQGPALKLRKGLVDIGLPVAIAGMGLSGHLKFTFGDVGSLRDSALAEGLLFDCTNFPGNSGGVVVDESGRIVAVSQGFIAAVFTKGDGTKEEAPVLAYGSRQGELRAFLAPYLP